jgi:hypothetical protein
MVMHAVLIQFWNAGDHLKDVLEQLSDGA